MTVTIVVIAASFAVGLLANRLLSRRMLGDEAEPLTVKDLTGPLQTLAVLVLAFVLVMAADSFGAAEEAARNEAAAVEQMFEVAEFVPEGVRERPQAVAVCYARSVIHQEWPTMKDGHHSPVPDEWANQFGASLKPLRNTTEFPMLLAADDDRSKARRDRLSQSTPAIPDVMYWFMLVTLALTVIAVAFILPTRRAGAEIATLAVFTALLTASLLVIHDVDRPYRGVINVDSVSMSVTLDDIAKDFVATYGAGKVPCDEQGLPA
ncbi:bestrophin-like domain [Streptomyces boluensis]|uniref:DUF4239 domain-containing protein n=1 Tax=Streptomyces boluensis TaxID=1775135 RepID=A0A964UMU5_9ACTN|nr:DUF4239 domain-containing protein [Streptomyces boluensis]NBE51956.1 DUF4239 domain-containing protein [Streptomyces boluensis]